MALALQDRRRVRPRSASVVARFAPTTAIRSAPRPGHSGSDDRANHCSTPATADCCRGDPTRLQAPGYWAVPTRPAHARRSGPLVIARCTHRPSRCCRSTLATRPTATAGCGCFAVAPTSGSAPFAAFPITNASNAPTAPAGRLRAARPAHRQRSAAPPALRPTTANAVNRRWPR
ncbi:hypothetical protein D3C86_1333330 [compost metagenome]